MIRKATFENFKGLRHVDVTFDSRFTVLVGPNGSGKTSVLQGIELQWHQLGAGQTTLHRYCTAGTDSSKVAIVIETDPPSRKRDGFGPIQRPQFRSAQIARASVTQHMPPVVENDGTGIPSLLGYLKLRDDELFDHIERRFCAIIPTIKKIRVDRGYDGGPAAGELLLFDTTFASKVPAEQMSDGTLYILALIVAILGPHRPKTLLIDDLDLRLHPKAQYELVTLLKEFLKEFPDLQIIATSHSPYILDKLEPNEVRVTGLDDDGAVVVARLDEHPQYAKWKDAMSPGEFWSHVGEDWLRGLHKNGVPAG